MANKKDKQRRFKAKGEGGKRGRENVGSHRRSNVDVVTDARFSSLHWDPRFQRAPRNHSKVPLDRRFHKVFKDKNFSSSSASMDKRGKRRKPHPANHLQHYYLQDPKSGQMKSNIDGRYQNIEDNNTSDSDLSVSEELSIEEDTSDESKDIQDMLESEEILLEEEDIPTIERETRRLAVVNMDWNFIKSVDLFVAFSSDLPIGGQVLSVAIYPSEFGLKRMEEEAVRGPIALFDNERENSEDEIDNEKLRAYEISRLSYYFAVVECDSSATADHLYRNFDGFEFERSSNKFDLRFIPDCLEFKHQPRDIATEIPSKYKPLNFSTRALQQTKVNLSWDDDDPDRKILRTKKFTLDQLDELDQFMASDDDTSVDEDGVPFPSRESRRELYRSLLQSGDGSGSDADDGGEDMEVTFDYGLEEISKRVLEKKDKKSETVWEAYMNKRSEKKKARKKNSKILNSNDDVIESGQEDAAQPYDDFFEESCDNNIEDADEINKKGSSKIIKGKKKKKEKSPSVDEEKQQIASKEELELLVADDRGSVGNLKGYNLKSKKGKKGKEVVAEENIPAIDFDDPRFAPLFNSHLYALDPTDPQFKRSATYFRQLAEKQREGRAKEEKKVHAEKNLSSTMQSLPDNNIICRHKKRSQADIGLSINDTPSQADDGLSFKDKPELSSLVRSIKRKVGSLQR